MLEKISEIEFLKTSNSHIQQIEVSDLLGLIDDNLLECKGIVVSFNDKKILIENKESSKDQYEFIYYKYAPSEREILTQKIVSTDDEKIIFIRIENEEDNSPCLRFQIGNRPILVTATDEQILMVGLSHWDTNDKWLDYENNILLNG